ncbi:hypothetical protein [Ureibacillus manganicus]|uniref:HrgC protein n=1 Tax=Ureibacillus manganicus DSM 26584 TaxID=1384049 RepID=A0A0A3HQP5_9BACL|nr:hypothetical protein [Ureibacillus manganicus]KGR73550.1 hypothetical protein CD29_19730 [Ureibacillus manganicus DSM 26584]
MNYVKLKNGVGLTKEMKVGFSWTTFFFGGWVALFRGQWGELVKWIFLNPITLGIWGLVQCWTANKKQIISFLEKGYEPMTEGDRHILVAREIIS